MTDKERLEMIKGIQKRIKECQEKGQNVSNLHSDYVDWLIEQAQRVEELEEEVEKQKNRKYLKMRQRDDFMKKAQRYKQALELIYKDTFYESEHDLISPIHVIRKRAEKALEGEG